MAERFIRRHLLDNRELEEVVAKSVKVHDDTHRVLKQLKAQKRSKSVDEVIRELIKQSTGLAVEKTGTKKTTELTTFLSD